MLARASARPGGRDRAAPGEWLGVPRLFVPALLAAAVIAGGLPAQAGPAPAGRAPALSYLHVGTAGDGTAQVLDAEGRVVLLRGVNVNGMEDYYQDSRTPLATPYPTAPAAYEDGRCPAANHAVETMAVCSFDAGQIKGLGYDVVRLALSWSLLEPEAGRISARHLDRVAQVVGWFRAKGVRVMLDLHQDAWSKYVFTAEGTSCPPGFNRVGGYHEADGAPSWATSHQLPACALGGVRELDGAVQANFEAFYADQAAPDGVGLQEHYAAVLAALVRRFAHDPTVAGYDLMNEPSPGFTPGLSSAALLLRIDAAFVAAMRAAVPDFRQLVVIEPEVTRDVTDQGAVALPWSAFSPYPNVVYGPHVYPGVFTPDAALADAAGTPRFVPVHASYLQAERDARVLGLPLWVGEFGGSVSDDSTYLRGHYVEQDLARVGGALWVWKEFSRGHDSVLHDPFGRGVPYPSRVLVTDRGYPEAVNGWVTSLSYEPDSGGFLLSADGGRPGGPPTLLHLPARARGPVRTQGATVRVTPLPSGDRAVVVSPTSASYRVQV